MGAGVALTARVQLSTARSLIDNIGKVRACARAASGRIVPRCTNGCARRAPQDYLRMIKYGDSLYRCKQLKRAALGR